jgi:hypothetical protein
MLLTHFIEIILKFGTAKPSKSLDRYLERINIVQRVWQNCLVSNNLKWDGIGVGYNLFLFFSKSKNKDM